MTAAALLGLARRTWPLPWAIDERADPPVVAAESGALVVEIAATSLLTIIYVGPHDLRQLLEQPSLFRRCEECGTINIIKEDVFECAVCETALSRAWNLETAP